MAGLSSHKLNLTAVLETVLILLASLSVMYYFSRQSLREEARCDAEQTLEGTVQQIDNILMSVEQTADYMYQEVQSHLDQPERMFTYSQRIVESNPYITGCAIAFKPYFYPDRDLFMAYVHRDGSGHGDGALVKSRKFGSRPYTEQVWYTTPMSTGRAYWTEPLEEEEGEGVTLSYCLPLFDDHHSECVGVLVVDLPISLLSQIVLAAKPSPNSYSILLSRKGSFIVHPDAERLSKQTTVFNLTKNVDNNVENATVLQAAKAMMAGETGYKPFRLNHQDWYVFYKPFRHWSAGVIYLEDDVLGDYNILIYLVLGITIIGVLLFFGLSRLLIRRQMKPLHLLTRSAERITDGHYDEPVPNAQREDEIGQLQDHFQKMQRSLAAKRNELKQLTSMLKKRGEDLQKAYRQTQGSDRMKTTFLHYMTTQMVVPTDLIERSVIKLSNNYHDMGAQEADYEVGVIKQQSKEVLDLLDHMIEALETEVEESEKGRKEGAHE